MIRKTSKSQSRLRKTAPEDPTKVDSDLENVGESLVLTEKLQRQMGPAPEGKTLEMLLKRERQSPMIAGNPPEVTASLRLNDLCIADLTERERTILAVGMRCGELSKENSMFQNTKRWIEEEIKGQISSLSAVTRQLAEAGEMHTTYALFNSPNMKRKHDAISSATITSDGIDITKLNQASLEDIWRSWDQDAKIDAFDHYIVNILNLDPQPMYNAGNWAADVAFIPRWHLVAYGKNMAQYRTVYADDIQLFRTTLERTISKKMRVDL